MLLSEDSVSAIPRCCWLSTTKFLRRCISWRVSFLTDNKGALPLAVLETIWAIIAFVGLIQIVACTSSTKDSGGNINRRELVTGILPPPDLVLVE